ncbi:MAG: vWA domain-containing protein [Candidatus Woesearchaeota archaeon]
MSSFVPDSLFSQMTTQFSQTRQQFGDSILQYATGYDADYLQRNIKIPEFQKQLQKQMNQKARELEDKDFIDDEGSLTQTAKQAALLELYIRELDALQAKGFFGSHTHNIDHVYGERQDVRPYKKGDRFRDVSIKKTAHTALRRLHTSIQPGDFRISTRQSRGDITVLYAIDASSSMRGEKIAAAKRAGMALAYAAIQNNDSVGLIVFSDTVVTHTQITKDFQEFAHALVNVKAQKQTDLACAIDKSIELFENTQGSKHVIIITDAEGTVGDDPKKRAMDAAYMANEHDISLSIVGVGLEDDAFARQVAEVGKGKLYIAKNIEKIDLLVLQDYDQLS